MLTRSARCASAFAAAILCLATAPQEPGPWPAKLVDVAQRSGLTRSSVYGNDDRKRFIIETNGAGTAFVDYDRDGWLDALVLSGTRLQNENRREVVWPPGEEPRSRLYRNQKGANFQEVTPSGLDRVGWASSVCAGDYNADGWIDLLVTYFGQNVLYRNVSGSRFQDVTNRAGLPTRGVRWGSGCSFLDYDRDGDLDLFVANYLRFDLAAAPEPGEGANCRWKGIAVNCGPKGLPTDTNLLYRNRGDGVFEDVSEPSGVARVTGRYPMTAIAADLDADGWVDLYVASDSTAAILYRNNRDGTFTDVAIPSGAAFNDQGNAQAGMGAALGDFDRDGRLDVLKTHFSDDIPALYRSVGRGLFEDVATIAGLGVQNRHVQWGAGMPDLDNDGWPDLFYVTGHVYPEVERVLPQYPYRGPRVVFRNMANGRFADVTGETSPDVTHSSRGASFGDYDNDGDVDVLVMNMNEPPSLLRNEYAGGNRWLSVRLEGRTSNRTAIGATVVVTAGGRRQARAVVSQSSYYSHDDLRLHFGLGSSERAERVEVRWPNGAAQVIINVRGGQVLTVEEDSSPK